MSTIINGSTNAITFPDATIQTTAFKAGAVTQSTIATGVAGTGPAFRVSLASNQTVSSTVSTKVTLTTEAFDTANAFNNTGSTVGTAPAYSFNPQIAGYYQINATVGAESTSSLSYNYIQIRKNGGNDTISIYAPYISTNSYASICCLMFLNGTTDYVELYSELAGTGTLRVLGGVTHLSGSLVRAA